MYPFSHTDFVQVIIKAKGNVCSSYFMVPALFQIPKRVNLSYSHRLLRSTTTSFVFTSSGLSPCALASSGFANTLCDLRAKPTIGPKVANFRSRIVDHHIAAVSSADNRTSFTSSCSSIVKSSIAGDKSNVSDISSCVCDIRSQSE